MHAELSRGSCSPPTQARRVLIVSCGGDILASQGCRERCAEMFGAMSMLVLF